MGGERRVGEEGRARQGRAGQGTNSQHSTPEAEPPNTQSQPVARCSAGGRLWGKCKGSSFTDQCLIVSREAPEAAGVGGAAVDFRANFECFPAAAAKTEGATVLDRGTQGLLPKLGASGTAADDRCFNLGGSGAAPALCVTRTVAGGQPACTNTHALCFKANCDKNGQMSVIIGGLADGKSTQLACPTGALVCLIRVVFVVVHTSCGGARLSLAAALSTQPPLAHPPLQPSLATLATSKRHHPQLECQAVKPLCVRAAAVPRQQPRLPQPGMRLLL